MMYYASLLVLMYARFIVAQSTESNTEYAEYDPARIVEQYASSGMAPKHESKWNQGNSGRFENRYDNYMDNRHNRPQGRMEPVEEDKSPLQRWLEEGRYFQGAQNRDGYGGGGGYGGCYCQSDDNNYAIGFGLASIAAGLVLAAVLAAQAAAAGRRRRRSVDSSDVEDDKATWMSHLTNSWLKFGDEYDEEDDLKADKKSN